MTNSFGIGAVARLAGLSSHVIRAWERRYGAIEPIRDQGGTRRYRREDVERLRLLRDGIGAGHRIGDLAGLSDEQIRAFLPEPPWDDAPGTVGEMLAAVGQLAGHQLCQLLSREALALGPFDFCRLVVRPLLHRIGEQWAQGELRVAEEHMATAAIKGTLLSLLRFGSGVTRDVTTLFSTFPGERHEIGALIAALCAQDAGARVLYLGPDLPISEIVAAAHRSAAKIVGISAATPATEEQMTNLSQLKNELPRGVRIWIGGRGWSKVEIPSGVRHIGTLEELRERVLRLSMSS